jgi:gas vesicle protein
LDAASWGFIGTLIGAIVGASASVLTTTINSRNGLRLQKVSNDLDRAERSRAFQRETLLNTQDIVQDLMRLMARAYIADMSAHRQSGQWGRNMLPDELNESMLIANRKMIAYVERVADDSLRSTLKNLHGQISRVGQSESSALAEAAFQTVGPSFEAAMTQFGSALRGYY